MADPGRPSTSWVQTAASGVPDATRPTRYEMPISFATAAMGELEISDA